MHQLRERVIGWFDDVRAAMQQDDPICCGCDGAYVSPECDH